MRTPNDICLLCKKNTADKKGSHFTPIGILKKVVGKRNNEHEVTIDPGEGEVTQYYGRGNLKNTDTTIRKSDNVADHIFCTECDQLNLFSNKLSLNSLPLKKNSKGNLFFQFGNPHKNLIIVFFYSVIWRQMLQNVLTYGMQFNPQFMEVLRQIVYSEVSSSLDDIKNSKKFAHYPKLIITLVDSGTNDTTGLNYGPNPYPSNPELFAIGEYQNLIFENKNISKRFSLITKLPNSIIDIDLVINNSDLGIIGIIDTAVWNNRIKWFNAKAVDDFSETYIKKI